MEQGSAVVATTDTRRWLHALRPFLLLGGFVLVWWCLATGTAQAAEVGHHDVGTPTTSVARTSEKVVPHREHRATKVTRTVRHHVAPVAPTVRKTPVTPVVKATTRTVRTVVKPVVRKVHETLETKPAVPVVKAPESVDAAAAQAVGSSTLQGETGSQHTSAAAPAQTLSGSATAASTDSTSEAVAKVSQSPVRIAQAAPSGSPLDQAPAGHPLASTASAAASSAQLGSGSGPAGLCESGQRVVPDTTGTQFSASADRLDAGPAYPPSSSPD